MNGELNDSFLHFTSAVEKAASMALVQVYVGIGSNIDREDNVRGGLTELKSRYGDLDISPIYESKAFGFAGDDFYNLVVGFQTNFGVADIEAELRQIEYQFGRKRMETHYSSRTLDIDLLLYGDLVSDTHELPRADIIEYAFVLKPLCDLAPDLVHPVNGKTIRKLWDSFQLNGQQFSQIQGFIF